MDTKWIRILDKNGNVYITPIIEDEEEKAVVISQLVKDKTLLLYISNENTMPTLSIMKGAEEMRSGQLIPVAFDFGSMED